MRAAHLKNVTLASMGNVQPDDKTDTGRKMNQIIKDISEPGAPLDYGLISEYHRFWNRYTNEVLITNPDSAFRNIETARKNHISRTIDSLCKIGSHAIKEQIIFLAGGGDTKQSIAIDTTWIDSLDVSSYKTVVYIPFAQKPEKFDSAKQWFMDSYASRIGNLTIQVVKSSLDEVDWSEVTSIYIGGGKTDRLLKRLRRDGNNLEKLREYVCDGGNVYGGSAGAILLGHTIELAPEVATSFENPEGLNLLHGQSVSPHLGSSEGLDQQELVELSMRMPIIAIPENGGLTVNGKDELQSVGADVELRKNGGKTVTIHPD